LKARVAILEESLLKPANVDLKDSPLKSVNASKPVDSILKPLGKQEEKRSINGNVAIENKPIETVSMENSTVKPAENSQVNDSILKIVVCSRIHSEIRIEHSQDFSIFSQK
jgi:hypothetical protein